MPNDQPLLNSLRRRQYRRAGNPLTATVPVTAEQLRSWRRALGLTQASAAYLLGYSLRRYAGIESGRGKVPLCLSMFLRYRKDWPLSASPSAETGSAA